MADALDLLRLHADQNRLRVFAALLLGSSTVAGRGVVAHRGKGAYVIQLVVHWRPWPLL